MAGKFVELAEAARMLGVSPEQLVEMRSNGKIFGYRDGSSWKFKQEEVERVQAEQDSAGSMDDSAEILSADDADFEQMITGLSSKILGDRMKEDQQDSILISDDDLSSNSGASKKGPSTIIGRGGLGDENDITLGGGEKGPGHSDALTPSDLKMKTESDVLAGSAPRGPSGSATGVMAGGSQKNNDDDLSFAADSALGVGSDIGHKSVADDDLLLGDDSLGLDDLSLGDSESGASSGSAKKPASSKAEEVDEYDLSDDVLGDEPQLKGGSGGSDVTFGGGDSGINLAPSDAGLSLEEPLDLGGSAVSKLELPGDDDVIAMDDSLADPDQATQLKTDEQFSLSPDGFIEDASDSDSGSQVIALEESDSFDHDAATQLRSDDLQPSLVAEDAFTTAPMLGGSSPQLMPAGGAAAGYMMQPVETPYTIWQVLTLMILTGILAFSGMLMVDVMSNMWSWQGTGQASTSIADSVINMFGLDK